jgi:KDO2-lipid IV(A) lauroyltransferase
MMAHYASYEWAISVNHQVNLEGFVIYKKINNPYFDKLVRDIRSKFKAQLITNKEAIPVIINNNRNKKLCTYGFASDQSPKINSAYHWTSFMGIEVPVHVGAEVLAKKYNMNVVFLKVKKVKRGYYEASFEILSENAKEVPNYEITDKFIKLVEQQIYEAPEYYLWTHRRWKHRRVIQNEC